MACLQFLVVLHAISLGHADRDTNTDSEVAVQSAAAFSKANATISEFRHHSSNLQSAAHGHRRHHQAHHPRDRRMQTTMQRYDQDDQPPQEPVDAHAPEEYASMHGSRIQDDAQSQSDMENIPDESVDQQPPALWDRDQEGLQEFSRSRGQEDVAQARSRAIEDAAALAAADDNEGSSEKDGRHEMSEHFSEPHGRTRENHVEDIDPRAEEEQAPQSRASSSREDTQPRIDKRSQEHHSFAPEDRTEDVELHDREEKLGQSEVTQPDREETLGQSEVTQPVHLARQAPTSSGGPAASDNSVQGKHNSAPHFGSIDLNGDGFIDGLEFQAAVSRGDLR